MDWLTVSFLDGLGTVGTWGLLGLSLIFGKGLALQREVKQRDATIEWQRLTIKEQNAQIIELISGSQVAAKALNKVTAAAAAMGGDGA